MDNRENKALLFYLFTFSILRSSGPLWCGKNPTCIIQHIHSGLCTSVSTADTQVNVDIQICTPSFYFLMVVRDVQPKIAIPQCIA